MAGDNRRRVDPAERAEARRALVARVVVASLVLGALSVGAGAAYAGWRWVTTGDALRIREIRFEGLGRVKPDELTALSPVKAGDNLVAADLDAMERALLKHPWVRSARARRSLPPAVDVTVELRRAAAIVELDGLFLVDREANVFKLAELRDGLDLPLVTGLSRADFESRRGELEPVLAGALALVESYAASDLAKKAPLAEVHLEPEYGTTIYVGEHGTQVRLGSGDLPAKLHRLKRALADLEGGGEQADVLHLDNRVDPSRIAIRLAGGVAGASGVASLAPKAGGKGPRGP